MVAQQKSCGNPGRNAPGQYGRGVRRCKSICDVALPRNATLGSVAAPALVAHKHAVVARGRVPPGSDE